MASWAIRFWVAGQNRVGTILHTPPHIPSFTVRPARAPRCVQAKRKKEKGLSSFHMIRIKVLNAPVILLLLCWSADDSTRWLPARGRKSPHPVDRLLKTDLLWGATNERRCDKTLHLAIVRISKSLMLDYCMAGFVCNSVKFWDVKWGSGFIFSLSPSWAIFLTVSSISWTSTVAADL